MFKNKKRFVFRTRHDLYRVIFDLNEKKVYIYESLFKKNSTYTCLFSEIKLEVANNILHFTNEILLNFFRYWEVNLIVPELIKLTAHALSEENKKTFKQRLLIWFKYESPRFEGGGKYSITSRVFKTNAIKFAKKLARQIGLNYITVNDENSSVEEIKVV